MEAQALYDRFAKNLKTILIGLHADIPLDKTTLPVALPLEFQMLAGTLNQGAPIFNLKAVNLDVVEEFEKTFAANESRIMNIMHEQLSDKKSVIRNEEGTVLVKEMLIRRLEYINEAANTLETMIVQRRIGNQRVLESINPDGKKIIPYKEDTRRRHPEPRSKKAGGDH
jgi:hypothetical protein